MVVSGTQALQDVVVQPQPFTPEDVYCVYCHAPAAGQCAVCGALCCADCVELVMGLTTQRAVCASCLKKGRKPGGYGAWIWAVGALTILLCGVVALLL